MKKNILMHTNVLVCLVIVVGFLLTALLSYRANYSASLQNIEQVSALTSEGIYYQMSTTFSKPVNVSLTMANDSLLQGVLMEEEQRIDDPSYIETIKEYLNTYQNKYNYDSIFLVSAATARYYNFNGLDRVLEPGHPENSWYYDELLTTPAEYTMNVDNDEVAGAENAVTVFVNCKIKDAGGRLLGVVGVGVRIDGLQQTLKDYQDQFGVNAYLIDNDGTIEISTQHTGYEDVNLFEEGREELAGIRQDILNWEGAEASLNFWALDASGQKNDYVVARYLPEIQWHLVVERDTSELMAALHRQLLFSVAVIIIILSVILYIITRMIRRFNRQIVALTQAMEKERQVIFEKATEQLFENIYEVDVTHNRPANRATEDYFASLGAPRGCTYDRALGVVAEQQIKEEFRRGYLETFSPENVLRVFEAGTNNLTYELMLTQDGQQYYWVRIMARIVRWETDGTVHMLIYRQNIDAEKSRERKMQELAWTDEMTGLLTKTATSRQVDELLLENAGSPAAYFIFDIDNFKQANDLFGHAFGDSVICAFVEIIRENFRVGDVLGRVGGDEFVAFAPGAGRSAAVEKAQKLSRELSWTHTWGGMSWAVSASIGVALAPEHGTTADSLYKAADAALYQTKARGKNGFSLCGPADAPEG